MGLPETFNDDNVAVLLLMLHIQKHSMKIIMLSSHIKLLTEKTKIVVALIKSRNI